MLWFFWNMKSKCYVKRWVGLGRWAAYHQILTPVYQNVFLFAVVYFMQILILRWIGLAISLRQLSILYVIYWNSYFNFFFFFFTSLELVKAVLMESLDVQLSDILHRHVSLNFFWEKYTTYISGNVVQFVFPSDTSSLFTICINILASELCCAVRSECLCWYH